MTPVGSSGPERFPLLPALEGATVGLGVHVVCGLIVAWIVDLLPPFGLAWAGAGVLSAITAGSATVIFRWSPRSLSERPIEELHESVARACISPRRTFRIFALLAGFGVGPSLWVGIAIVVEAARRTMAFGPNEWRGVFGSGLGFVVGLVASTAIAASQVHSWEQHAGRRLLGSFSPFEPLVSLSNGTEEASLLGD